MRCARSSWSAAARRASQRRWRPSSRTLPPRSSCSATSGRSRTRSRRCRRPCSRERRCPMTRRLPARRAFPEAACASQAIDRGAHAVITDAGERIGYDALVLATGSINRVLPMFPAGQKGIYYLRTEAEARALKARLHQGGALLLIRGRPIGGGGGGAGPGGGGQTRRGGGAPRSPSPAVHSG